MSIEQEFADKLVQYKHIIYKVCFMYADNKDDVNDLFQESVFNIWKSYKNFRGESSFVTWVYRISYNPQIQISAESGTKRSIFRQKNKTKRSKKRLHTTLIKPEQKVNEDLCSGFIVS